MSTLNCNSCNEGNYENSCCIFAQFPEVENERIDTKGFLMASRGVVKLIDKFGKLFAPLKYDMQRSIEVLNARYLLDTDINSTLQDMILLDLALGYHGRIAFNALLWLTRNLHMIQVFFEKIVEDCKAEKSTEDLVAMLKHAYELTLEPYHGWMAKQLFELLSRKVPSRTDLLQSLAAEVNVKEDMILDVMNDFAQKLKLNVTAVHIFYEKYSIDFITN